MLVLSQAVLAAPGGEAEALESGSFRGQVVDAQGLVGFDSRQIRESGGTGECRSCEFEGTPCVGSRRPRVNYDPIELMALPVIILTEALESGPATPQTQMGESGSTGEC